MVRVVALGGPGDGDIIAETLRVIADQGGELTLHGFLNDALSPGTAIAGVPVLGKFDDWIHLPEDVMFMPLNHRAEGKPSRVARMRGLGIPNPRLAVVCHPTACVARNVVLGPGSFVASHVTIQPGAKIGTCVSIRAGANIGHDARLEDFTYVGPNATMCGHSKLLEGAHLGPNAALLERRVVGRFAVVGIGAAVMKNVEDFTIVLGNPARKLSSVSY
jgi:sugar O-acyltransferase (sialic acid O-acetyltransferase NeuD family)